MMRRSLSAGIISLSVGVAGACARQSVPPAPVAAAPDGCVVALAEGQGQDRLAAQIERARQDARRGPNAKAALERLGYLHVSRARVTSDAGHYKLAEAVADCLQASYPGDAGRVAAARSRPPPAAPIQARRSRLRASSWPGGRSCSTTACSATR